MSDAFWQWIHSDTWWHINKDANKLLYINWPTMCKIWKWFIYFNESSNSSRISPFSIVIDLLVNFYSCSIKKWFINERKHQRAFTILIVLDISFCYLDKFLYLYTGLDTKNENVSCALDTWHLWDQFFNEFSTDLPAGLFWYKW